MRVSLKSVFAGLTLGVIASSASAAIVNATSTVGESGFVGPQTGGTYPLTATPYNFTGQVNSLANVTSIDSLTVTLQISDGDSGPLDYDFNNLFLTLDGVNTGLALNDAANGYTVKFDQGIVILVRTAVDDSVIEDEARLNKLLDGVRGDFRACDP